MERMKRKSMEFEFWGVRGTSPVSPPEKTSYGGHTPCAALKGIHGDRIVIDAGTGMIRLGRKESRSPEKHACYHILITHFHLDHVMGLPFFSPLYDGDVALKFYAAAPEAETEKYLSGLMAGRYFPLDWDATPARKSYTDITDKEFSIGRVSVSSCPLNHPQESVAYRFKRDGRILITATDTEHPESGCDGRLADFCRRADVLVYDASFTPEEYAASRRGWGHSTWEAGAALALEAGVGKLILSHFNPEYSDAVIEAMIRRARERFAPTEGAHETG